MSKKVKNDFVLAMTGYHPDFDFLESSGIKLSDGNDKIPVYDPDTYESNQERLFLAGVVCGGMKTGEWFIENARIHAPKIFNRIKQYGKNNS